MNIRKILPLIVLIFFLLFTGFYLIKERTKRETPEVVTRKFYAWWLRYPGNPLVDKAHYKTDYLTEEFADKIDKLFEREGYDPLTLTKNVAEQIKGTDASISGKDATVIVYQFFALNPIPHRIKVHLKLINGKWKINNVTPLK